MKRLPSSSLPRPLMGSIALAISLFPALLVAATVTWDGNGDSNTSGLWEATSPDNWSITGIPGAADNARLLDVTTGTRIITISTAQTINQLTLAQSTAGATNTLQINQNLTVSGNAAPFVITPSAGQ